MASYTARKNKDGQIISYQIKVSRGRDKLTGKQLTPYTMTYTPPAGWSSRALKHELVRIMGEFEAACRRGEVLTRAQAKEQEQHRREQEAQDKAEAERRPTFNSYTEHFLNARAKTASPNTLVLYQRTFDQIGAVFGALKLEDITAQAVREYFADLQANGTNRKTGAPLAYNTILKHWLNLHALFESAVDEGVLSASPMWRMKRPKPRRDETPHSITAYSKEEVKYILECADKEPPKWRAFIRFALDSGCRRGEILGLKWADIDLRTGRVQIVRNVQYTGKEYGTYITKPKSGKGRTITINAPVVTALAQWKLEQLRELVGQGLPASEYVFTTETGAVMAPNTPSVYMQRFGKRYKIPDLHCHAFRHTMATIAIQRGADPVSVSEKLGHAKPSITLDVYSHANDESQRRVNEIIAGALYDEAKQA